VGKAWPRNAKAETGVELIPENVPATDRLHQVVLWCLLIADGVHSIGRTGSSKRAFFRSKKFAYPFVASDEILSTEP